MDDNYYNINKNVETIKNIYGDYKEIGDFFTYINNNIASHNQKHFGFGFCNDTKSMFTPIFNDIAIRLIIDDFNLDMEFLKKNHLQLYFDNCINKFVHYINERPYKKYYHYQTIKKAWSSELYTSDEKIQLIHDYFKTHKLSEKYDISINAPVSFINVKLIEK